MIMVRGCHDWYKEGLAPPEEVLSATQDYRDEMDVLGEFIRECCIEHPNAEVPSQRLWSEWQKWCAVKHLPKRTLGGASWYSIPRR